MYQGHRTYTNEGGDGFARPGCFQARGHVNRYTDRLYECDPKTGTALPIMDIAFECARAVPYHGALVRVTHAGASLTVIGRGHPHMGRTFALLDGTVPVESEGASADSIPHPLDPNPAIRMDPLVRAIERAGIDKLGGIDR
jgi:hypothetical protein